MRKLVPGFALFIPILFVSAAFVACGDDSYGATTSESNDGSLKGAVVTVNGYTYNCIKYTTVDRGGLWCERVN